MLFSAVFVGFQFGLGGYRQSMVPIFCLAEVGSAFVFAILPTCVISAIFLTLVMLLLFKIFDIASWNFKPKVYIYIMYVIMYFKAIIVAYNTISPNLN